MPTLKLVARVDNEEQGRFLVRAPAVGVVDGVPEVGVYLNPLEAFLTLRVLDRRHAVQLPRGVQGRVVERLIEDTATPVAYGQPLFRLSPIAEEPVAAERSRAGARAPGAADAELIAVVAPSEGVFYRRPGPDSPAYVEQGSHVGSGTVLGLVEVMKSFNQIAYGGAGLPERGVVERILVEDAAEVAFGQTLFLVRPA